MHIFSKTNNNLGANGIVGAWDRIPLACGAGMGIKAKKTDQVVIVFFSDGAANNGVFGEGLNFASAFMLPVIFMVENNHYAVSTPVECSFGNCDLACKGPAFGMPGLAIDGNDALAVYLSTKQAVERARKGEGPTLIEAKTYRHGGHHINDPGAYMDQKVLAEWKERGPLKLLRNKIDNKADHLRERGALSGRAPAVRPLIPPNMEDFRHNLSPVEVKLFLKTVTKLTEDLFIRFCYKMEASCPKCGHTGLCKSGAVSLYSGSFDKLTHEISVCLKCGHISISALLTCEKM